MFSATRIFSPRGRCAPRKVGSSTLVTCTLSKPSPAKQEKPAEPTSKKASLLAYEEGEPMEPHLKEIIRTHNFMNSKMKPAKGGRKTKIVATIGPTSNTKETLYPLAENGMSVCRLNMSHGDHQSHKQVVDIIKEYNARPDCKQTLAIMLDTKGPEVRSGDLKEPVMLRTGDTIIFSINAQSVIRAQASPHPGEHVVAVNYDGFVKDVAVGNSILVDGGIMVFNVEEIDEENVYCKVVDGGLFKSRRHLNIRGKSANLPSITDKDWDDINFGIEQEMDFIALSFVKDAAVIHELRDYLRSKNSEMQIIAKIESAASVDNLEEILEATDGVMVARGDLGSELPIEEVPILQAYMVRRCREMGKPVIVATNMLESMVVNPRPTRAEVSDISIAVAEGADAVMLSGETAFGSNPVTSLLTMHTVAQRTEAAGATAASNNATVGKPMVVRPPPRPASIPADDTNLQTAMVFARHTVEMADMLGAYVVVFTRSGFMASLLSQNRPKETIFAFTDSPVVQRRLALYHGVTPLCVNFTSDADESFTMALDLLRSRGLVKAGDPIAFVQSGRQSIWRMKNTHTIQVRTVPDAYAYPNE
eukprot:jgi/Mesvir1/23947/Mv10718-RA.1